MQCMATWLQTIVVEYDDHCVLPDWLNQMASEVNSQVFRKDRFSFALGKVGGQGDVCSDTS